MLRNTKNEWTSYIFDVEKIINDEEISFRATNSEFDTARFVGIAHTPIESMIDLLITMNESIELFNVNKYLDVTEKNKRQN